MSLLNVYTSTEGKELPKYVAMEPGIYEFEITNELEVKPSKNPSADGVNYGNIPVELKNLEEDKTVRDWISLHPKMAWKKNQFVASAGVEADGGQVDLADFRGRIVKAVIKQETYKNNEGEERLRNKVDEYVVA